jgi:hypothetical protein
MSGCAAALCARRLGTDCWCGWMERDREATVNVQRMQGGQ